MAFFGHFFSWQHCPSSLSCLTDSALPDDGGQPQEEHHPPDVEEATHLEEEEEEGGGRECKRKAMPHTLATSDPSGNTAEAIYIFFYYCTYVDAVEPSELDHLPLVLHLLVLRVALRGRGKGEIGDFLQGDLTWRFFWPDLSTLE